MMGDQSRKKDSDGVSKLERINHWIRVILGIVALTVFIVGMIAYYFTYR
jgi:hypothetical protein